MQFAVTLIAVTLAVALCSAAEFPDTTTITAASVKKMNMKELRYHLRRRGTLCPDCLEKNDFRARLVEQMQLDGNGGVLDEAGARAFEERTADLKQAGAGAANAGAKAKAKAAGGDADVANVLKKKLDENQRMQDILKRAGMDTSHIDTNGYGGLDMGDLYSKIYDEKRAEGRKAKQERAERSARDAAAERTVRDAPDSVASADDVETVAAEEDDVTGDE
jgi:hypothetical protein